MPNTKIDSIKLSDNIIYDINLPIDATPSIAGLTTNGDSNFNGDVNINTNSLGLISSLTAPLVYGNITNGLILTNYKGSGAGAPDGASIKLDGEGGITLSADQGIILNTSESQSGIDIKAADELNLSSTISQVNVKLGNNTISFPQGKAGTIALTSDIDTKQDTLVSGTNIKRINNNSILGDGNLDTLQMSLEYADDSEIIQGLTLLQPIESSLSTTKKDKVSIKYGSFLINNTQVINQYVPFKGGSFTYPPFVTITPVIGNASEAATNVYCYITEVTKTGFRFTVTSGNSSLPVSKVFYTAIGQ